MKRTRKQPSESKRPPKEKSGRKAATARTPAPPPAAVNGQAVATGPDTAAAEDRQLGPSITVGDDSDGFDLTQAAPPAYEDRYELPTPAAAPRPSIEAGRSALAPCMTADNLTATKTEYMWRPYLPQSGLVFLTGDSEAGKSTFLTAIAAHVTGGPPIEGPLGRARGRVLIYGSEEDLSSTYKPRLVAAGADLGRVIFGDIHANGQRLAPLLLPEHLETLRSRIRHSGISVVILDPIDAYLGDALDDKSNRSVRAMLTALMTIGHDEYTLIIFTRHPRKDPRGGAKTRVGGVAAWTQVPRVGIGLGSDPDRPLSRVLTMVKNSLGADKPSRLFSIENVDGTPRFKIGRPTSMTADDVATGGDAPGERDAMADACAFLKDQLEAEEGKANDLRTRSLEACIAPVTLRRAKAKLGVSSHQIGPNGARYVVWRKPESGWPE